MKILVTGAKGQLGSDVASELKKRGHDVVAADIAEKLDGTADGYYFMVPFNRAGMIAEIMKRISIRP